MNQVVQCDECRDESIGARGYDMDDILTRLRAVESSISALRAEVSGIAAVIPFLETKADSIARNARLHPSAPVTPNSPALHLSRGSTY
jgi:hypothetical protein